MAQLCVKIIGTIKFKDKKACHQGCGHKLPRPQPLKSMLLPSAVKGLLH